MSFSPQTTTWTLLCIKSERNKNFICLQLSKADIMNLFVLVCTIFCIILLLFIVYAFIANKDSAPVSAQQQRLLSKSVNISSSPNESLDNNTDSG
jgi:hypothetical protein